MPNKKAKGKRANTRHKFKKKGAKLTVNKLLQEFDIGQKVALRTDASVHSGMPARRFHGRTATVKGMRGRAVLVTLKDGKTEKTLITHPAHLTQIKS